MGNFYKEYEEKKTRPNLMKNKCCTSKIVQTQFEALFSETDGARIQPLFCAKDHCVKIS